MNEDMRMGGIDGGGYIFVSHASADNARLRPVLIALLDAGLPLWFDKPDHHDVALPASQFAGSLQGAHAFKWRPLVNKAIREAAGILHFPSAAAAASREVTAEVIYAQALADSDDRFLIISALMGAEDGEFEEKLTRGLHCFSTSVSPAVEAGYKLNPESRIQVENLIAVLTNHLRAPSRPRPSGDLKLGDYHIPYLTDRRHQREHAIAAFTSLARPPVFVLHGPMDEAPPRFTSINLPRQVLSRHPFFRLGGASASPMRLSWPASSSSDRETFHLNLARKLFDACQGAEPIGSVDTWCSADLIAARAAEAIRKDAMTRIVVAELDAQKLSSPQIVDAIEAWIAFWDDFPFHGAQLNSHFLIVPVLEIIHPDESGHRLRLWMGRSERIRRTLDSAGLGIRLRRTTRQVTPHVLPGLSGVTPRCVREWVVQENLLDGQQDGQDKLIADLCDLFPQKSAHEKSLPMRTWARAAAPLLRAAGIE